MPTIAEELALLPFFSKVPRSDLERAAPLFKRVLLAPNELLWSEGSAVDELALLVYGELAVSTQLREVGRVRAPDIAGETGAFVAGSVRSATLKAMLPTTLLTLALPDLRKLRFQRSRVYEALLTLAQRASVKRVAATNAKLARVVAGSFAACCFATSSEQRRQTVIIVGTGAAFFCGAAWPVFARRTSTRWR